MHPVIPLRWFLGSAMGRFLGCLATCLVFLAVQGASAIPITGANGKVVNFAGVKSAGPGGLTVQIRAGDDPIELPWDKLDLQKLETEQPTIFEAYRVASRGQSRDLNLGSFAPKEAPMNRTVPTFEDGGERHGWFEAGAGGGKFALQLPSGGEPRGVLLISFGNDGRSIRYIGGVGANRWADFAEKFQFAVMSYTYTLSPDLAREGLGEAAKYIRTDEGSGQAVLDALNDFAQKSGKANLAKAPIAVYGTDVLGAAFAYNLTQSIPERILAAVASKGAYYSGKPTEASAKVPLLMIWGEYDTEVDQYQPTNTHDEIYPTVLELKPNWIYAMEPRGTGGESPFSQKLATTFLDRMILARLGTGTELKELDRTRSWTGDLDSFEISRMEDPEAVLTETQTWLPDGEIAKLWEDFLNETMTLDPPGQ